MSLLDLNLSAFVHLISDEIRVVNDPVHLSPSFLSTLLEGQNSNQCCQKNTVYQYNIYCNKYLLSEIL